MRKAAYFLGFVIVLVALTNDPIDLHTERYECTGAILDKFIIQQELYDADGNPTGSKNYVEIEGKLVESDGKSKVLNANGKLHMMYNPFGYWSGLFRGFSFGGLRVYELSTDTAKYFRVYGAPSLFYLEDKEGKKSGYFDLLKNTAYIALPSKDGDRVAFGGTCKRTL
jgi:hypothetical protein